MNDFLDKLEKIRSGFFNRMRLLFILDLITVSSIFYAIFIILQLEYFLNKSTFYLPVPVKFILPVLAFIIGLTSASLLHRKDKGKNVILLVEKGYPELKEKLRTAYDNRAETNVIVESLKDLVSEGLGKVSASHLLSKSKIISKILVTMIFISGAAIIVMNPDTYSIPPDTIANNFKNITGIGKEGGNETIQVVGRPESFDKVGTKGGGDIYGKPKIASIEGKNIDLTLYSGSGTGFEVREASQAQGQFIRSAAFPVDVLGSNVSDGGYGILMKKTENEKQLINKYAVERSKI